MKLGAEPKKVAILGGLLVVAVMVYFMNSSSDGPPRSSGATSASTARPSAGIRLPSQQVADVPMGRPAQTSSSRTNNRQGRVLSDFKPSMKPKRPEDRPDPMTVDPTLRLDLLAKLQAVGVEGVHRSVFEFTQPPAAPASKPDPTKVKPVIPDPRLVAQQAPVPAMPAAPPPPPPIPLKFYGYVTPSSAGTKRAFFLEGEDIHVVTEGDLVKRRYKIVRIGVNSVVVEDTQFKNQQTLPLEEQPG